MLPHITEVWYVGTAAEVVGRIKLWNGIALQHLACIWVQQIMNVWSVLLFLLHAVISVFPLIFLAHMTYTPWLAMSCRTKQVTMTWKIIDIGLKKSEKCTNIAKHHWLAPSINKLCYDCIGVVAVGKMKVEGTWTWPQTSAECYQIAYCLMKP